jgi:nitroreductase
MDVFEAIEKRHSYRGPFTDAPVPREDLVKIAQAGIRAANACNAQIATFVIVDDPELLEQIAAVLDRTVCKTAKAMIACVEDPRPVYKGIAFTAEDCASSVANMLLAVTALGYATVWFDGILRRDKIAERLNTLLGVPADKNVRILLPIGVPAEPKKQMEKLPFGQRAWFNKWGAE